VTTFLQLIVVGISTGSVFGLVGMALVLVYRTTGIVNFAQGVSAVLGGLLTFELQQHMPLAAAIAAAIILAALLGSLTAVIAVGIRGRTTHLASLIITVGIALLAEAILLATFGEVPRSYAGISEHAWDIGGVLVQPQYVLIAAVAIAAAVGLTFFLRRTIVGQALVASADSPRAAELVGLNVRSIAVIAFAVAAGLCALGGALLAPTVPVVYNADLAITINGFAAAVFGGLASIRLALLGGYALGIVEQLVVGYVDPQYNLTIALVAMLILIGWRSRGELAV
jgi:branched-chain amino acid transport system permease protein